jgi:hypothetical protein
MRFIEACSFSHSTQSYELILQTNMYQGVGLWRLTSRSTIFQLYRGGNMKQVR